MTKAVVSILICCLTSLIISCENSDPTRADTDLNKKRFKKFFNFAPSPDIKYLYYYSEEIGFDASYWFSFQCHDSTIEKIINNLGLVLDDGATFIKYEDGSYKSIPERGIPFYGGLNTHPVFWWDTAFIKKSVPFVKKEDTLHWYLCYDGVSHRAYFLFFDT